MTKTTPFDKNRQEARDPDGLETHDKDRREAHLERLIHGVLREQPLLRAPASLEARVLAAIEREASPWWRSGFVQWPLGARAAMFAVLLLVSKLTLDAVMWLFSHPTPVSQTLESTISRARSTASVFSSVLQVGQSVLNVIPGHWITLALVFAAGMYFMLFVLGATAYRTLYLNK
jgi:hypothetical protein